MKQRVVFVVGILSLFIFMGGVLFLMSKEGNSTPVYHQELSGTSGLSDSCKNWVTTKNKVEGMFVYAYEEDERYELLLHYNKKMNLEHYSSVKMKSEMVGNVLRVYFTGMDEKEGEKSKEESGQVMSVITSYILLKQKPTTIEVYVNDQITSYDMVDETACVFS